MEGCFSSFSKQKTYHITSPSGKELQTAVAVKAPPTAFFRVSVSQAAFCETLPDWPASRARAPQPAARHAIEVWHTAQKRHLTQISMLYLDTFNISISFPHHICNMPSIREPCTLRLDLKVDACEALGWSDDWRWLNLCDFANCIKSSSAKSSSAKRCFARPVTEDLQAGQQSQFFSLLFRIFRLFHHQEKMTSSSQAEQASVPNDTKSSGSGQAFYSPFLQRLWNDNQSEVWSLLVSRAFFQRMKPYQFWDRSCVRLRQRSKVWGLGWRWFKKFKIISKAFTWLWCCSPAQHVQGQLGCKSRPKLKGWENDPFMLHISSYYILSKYASL